MCAFSSSPVVPPYVFAIPWVRNEATKKPNTVWMCVFLPLWCVYVLLVRVDRIVGDGCSLMPRGNWIAWVLILTFFCSCFFSALMRLVFRFFWHLCCVAGHHWAFFSLVIVNIFFASMWSLNSSEGFFGCLAQPDVACFLPPMQECILRRNAAIIFRCNYQTCCCWDDRQSMMIFCRFDCCICFSLLFFCPP